jgi:hypothetical protein
MGVTLFQVDNPPQSVLAARARMADLRQQILDIEATLNERQQQTDDASRRWRQRATAAKASKLKECRFVQRWLEEHDPQERLNAEMRREEQRRRELGEQEESQRRREERQAAHAALLERKAQERQERQLRREAEAHRAAEEHRIAEELRAAQAALERQAEKERRQEAHLARQQELQAAAQRRREEKKEKKKSEHEQRMAAKAALAEIDPDDAVGIIDRAHQLFLRLRERGSVEYTSEEWALIDVLQDHVRRHAPPKAE